MVDFDLPEDVELYAGFVFHSAPHRHKPGKFYVSLEEYPFHLWPPYVTAGAYVLSRAALIGMERLSQQGGPSGRGQPFVDIAI